jgi:hypothetical protein
LNLRTTFIAKLSRLLPHILMFLLPPSQPVPKLTKLLTSISSRNSSLYVKPRSIVRPLRLPLPVPRFPIRLNRPLLTLTNLLLQRVTISTHGLALPQLTLGCLVRPLQLPLPPPGLHTRPLPALEELLLQRMTIWTLWVPSTHGLVCPHLPLGCLV